MTSLGDQLTAQANVGWKGFDDTKLVARIHTPVCSTALLANVLRHRLDRGLVASLDVRRRREVVADHLGRAILRNQMYAGWARAVGPNIGRSGDETECRVAVRADDAADHTPLGELRVTARRARDLHTDATSRRWREIPKARLPGNVHVSKP